MDYTIHQLRVFIKVVDKQSVTKASAELFMTQPAVSIQLKKFQDQFSIPLTQVVGRQLEITDFGREIYDMASKAVEEIENIRYKTREYEGLISGKLKISSASTGKYVIPYFLAGFLAENSGIDLLLDVTNKTRVIESLRLGEIDFALVSVLPENLEVESMQLIENKLFLVGNSPVRDTSVPLIYREDGSATRLAMETYFSEHGNKKRKQIELTSNEAVKQAVIAGLGYSIMPLIGVHNELSNKQLFIQEAEGLPIVTNWSLIWIKGRKLPPVATAFLKFLQEHRKSIVEQHFDWLDMDKSHW